MEVPNLSNTIYDLGIIQLVYAIHATMKWQYNISNFRSTLQWIIRKQIEFIKTDIYEPL